LSASPRALGPIHRLVVKFGTATLIGEDGALDHARMGALAADIALARGRGIDVIVVTSGAVSCGIRALGGSVGLTSSGPRPIPEKQALAALGQCALMDAWRQHLAAVGLVGAQLLLTRFELERKTQFFNARACLEQLLKWHAIPLINENDTTAIDELKFGDNDGLAATVALTLRADLLVLMTHVDGVFSDDPRKNSSAQLLRELDPLDDATALRLGGPPGQRGSGGMATKLQAARRAVAGGIHTIIANGKRAGQLRDVLDGLDVGTWVPAPRDRARPNTLRAFLSAEAIGSAEHRVRVNAGAAKALREKNASLLPVGIAAVEGSFEAGEPILVLDDSARCIAKGLARYGSEELRLLIGQQTREIETLLGYSRGEEAIHRDELVLI